MKDLQQVPVEAGQPPLCFLLSGGTIGGWMQWMQWGDSPLGPPHGWSPHLQAVMATLLPPQAHAVLFWGESYVAPSNDAYAPTLGNKHPHALARPAPDNSSVLLATLQPSLRRVRDTGPSVSAMGRPGARALRHPRVPPVAHHPQEHPAAGTARGGVLRLPRVRVHRFLVFDLQ